MKTKTFDLLDSRRLDEERDYAPTVVATVLLTDDGAAILQPTGDPEADGLKRAFVQGISHEGLMLTPSDGEAFVRALQETFCNPCGLVLSDRDLCARLTADLGRTPAPPAALPAIAS